MKIWWSLMDYQTIMKLHEIWMTINLKVEEHIHNFFFSFLRFFCIYSKYHCQSYQNKPFSTDPLWKISLCGKQAFSFSVFEYGKRKLFVVASQPFMLWCLFRWICGAVLNFIYHFNNYNKYRIEWSLIQSWFRMQIS
jgi:hypothetical protein